MALLLAQARNVPQAHAALVAGRWERSRWEGVELADKTLGIVGLGRIGKLVADRAKAFSMRLVAYDPFVSADRARQMGVELLAARPGRHRVRLPHDPPAEDARRRPGSSTATCCSRPSRRCGSSTSPAAASCVESDLAECIRDGVIAGAALDVFDAEPTTVVAAVRARPASWPRRTSGRAPARRRTRPATRSPTWSSWPSPATSCRSPSTSNAAEANETIRPFLPLAERLGRLVRLALGEVPELVRVLLRRRHRRLRHAHPRTGRAEGLLRRRSATSRSRTSTPRSWRRSTASRCATSTARRRTTTST